MGICVLILAGVLPSIVGFRCAKAFGAKAQWWVALLPAVPFVGIAWTVAENDIDLMVVWLLIYAAAALFGEGWLLGWAGSDRRSSGAGAHLLAAGAAFAGAVSIIVIPKAAEAVAPGMNFGGCMSDMPYIMIGTAAVPPSIVMALVGLSRAVVAGGYSSAGRSSAYGVPRCQGCGYILIGLPEPRCPECGRPFQVR